VVVAPLLSFDELLTVLSGGSDNSLLSVVLHHRNHTSLISLQAIPWICMQKTSFYYQYVLSFAAHLQNSMTYVYKVSVLW